MVILHGLTRYIYIVSLAFGQRIVLDLGKAEN